MQVSFAHNMHSMRGTFEVVSVALVQNTIRIRRAGSNREQVATQPRAVTIHVEQTRALSYVMRAAIRGRDCCQTFLSQPQIMVPCA